MNHVFNKKSDINRASEITTRDDMFRYLHNVSISFEK